MKKLITKIEKYNQKGEGVAFHNKKPIYIFGTIIDEIVEIEVIEEQKTYNIGRVVNIIKKSKNRREIDIKNASIIGGYELIHMKKEEQKKFKIDKVKNDFLKISQIEIKEEEIEFFESPKEFKYRNKITLHDGSFYQKNTKIPINIDNYLLSDIEYDKNLKGKIIYRKLDTLIFGNKKEKKYTTDTMLNYKFRVGLNSFYQINKEVAQEVYAEIQNNIIENGNTLDMYSGIGTITIIASSKSKKVIGVERNTNSFQDALYNIKENKINNIKFYCLNVEKYVEKYKDKIKIDTLIIDPAREGVDKKTIYSIMNQIKPKRIIYLSCNPGTQASNLFLLKEKYKIAKIKIYDMFPQTYHIESLLILDRI